MNLVGVIERLFLQGSFIRWPYCVEDAEILEGILFFKLLLEISSFSWINTIDSQIFMII